MSEWFERLEYGRTEGNQRLNERLEELYSQTHIVHFTAVGKPWMYDVQQVAETKPNAHPLPLEQWARWRMLAMQECPEVMIDHV